MLIRKLKRSRTSREDGFLRRKIKTKKGKIRRYLLNNELFANLSAFIQQTYSIYLKIIDIF